MKFEQKFIQIPTNADYWGDSNWAAAGWYVGGNPKRILNQGFSQIAYDGLVEGSPQWIFNMGFPSLLGENQPIFSEISDALPTPFARGIFVNYFKIGVSGQEILQAREIHVEQSTEYEFRVRLLGEDSLFPGYLNLMVWNPIPPTFARNPQT